MGQLFFLTNNVSKLLLFFPFLTYPKRTKIILIATIGSRQDVDEVTILCEAYWTLVLRLNLFKGQGHLCSGVSRILCTQGHSGVSNRTSFLHTGKGRVCVVYF